MCSSDLDERDGPQDFTQCLRDTVYQAKELLVCMNCAGPLIVAIKRHQEPERDWSTEDVMWRELVSIAQGLPTTIRKHQVEHGRWPIEREDVFKRARWEDLKARRYVEKMDRREQSSLYSKRYQEKNNREGRTFAGTHRNHKHSIWTFRKQRQHAPVQKERGNNGHRTYG